MRIFRMISGLPHKSQAHIFIFIITRLSVFCNNIFQATPHNSDGAIAGRYFTDRLTFFESFEGSFSETFSKVSLK